MLEVFDEHRPQVVFHAAALKHLPLLEMHPREAVKTNVVGTQNVLSAARPVGVERFVNISTDKAADPISVLGYTKRICERLTAAAAIDGTGTYLSVRFGNVLGSRGSVLTAFHAQIEAGGPLTVTDPDVTRYFMTVEEAVQLVIQAGAVGRGGEALVLDMGEPVAHRRRGPPPGRAGRRARSRSSTRACARREAPRGAAGPGRGRRAPVPPADLAGAGAAPGLPAGRTACHVRLDDAALTDELASSLIGRAAATARRDRRASTADRSDTADGRSSRHRRAR